MTNEDKSAIISARIAARVAMGSTVRDALDYVCGAGTFARLASDLWEAANAQDTAKADKWAAEDAAHAAMYARFVR